MTLPVWPKIIKLSDVVDALDDLAEQVAANTQRLDATIADRDATIADRDATIAHLQHDLEEHKAGAIIRQAELDRLKADMQRQAWAQRTGRRL